MKTSLWAPTSRNDGFGTGEAGTFQIPVSSDSCGLLAGSTGSNFATMFGGGPAPAKVVNDFISSYELLPKSLSPEPPNTDCFSKELECSVALRDYERQAESGGESRLSILVRDGRHGRDEPSLGLRHSIDTTMMQVGSRGWDFGLLPRRERPKRCTSYRTLCSQPGYSSTKL